MAEEKDPIKLVGEVKALVEGMKKEGETINAELKKAAKESDDKLNATSAEAKEAIKVANEAAGKIVAMATAMTELQQKIAEGVKAGTVAPKTLGTLILETEEFKAYAEGKTHKFRYEANTIIGQEGSPPANSDVLVAPDRRPGIIPGAFRQLRIEEILPTGTTGSNSIEFTRELAFTNDAAETAEGDTKPQSDITYELINVPVRTIAHWIKASKQVLDDAPALRSHIDTRMRYGVDLRYDQQLLKGNGAGQNIKGILGSGNYTAFTPTASEIALDSVNRAIEAVQVADYAPTAIIMNTADWHAIERLKVDSTYVRNGYVVGDPLGVISRVLWGLPVVVTNAMTAGRFVVGAFDLAYQVFNRQSTVVEIFEQDEANVQKNLLTIRAERRGALAAYVPAAVRSGLLIAGSSS